MRDVGSKVLWLVALVTVCAGIWWWRSGHRQGVGGPVGNAFFVDEESGEEFILPASSVPPLMNKAGKAVVVQVFKYSCGAEAGGAPAIGFYIKYAPETQEAVRNIPLKNVLARNEALDRGRLIRAPAEGSPWVSDRSPEGMKVKRSLPCANATEVLPP